MFAQQFVRSAIATAGVVVALLLPASAAKSYLEDEPGIAALHWTTGSFTLAKSHARLTVPAGSRAIAGSDVDEFDSLQGPATGDGGDEAWVRFYHRGTVSYSFCGCGHASEADWSAFDAGAALRAVRASEESGDTGNERALGWSRTPSYDAGSHVLTWQMHIIRDETEDAYQAQALVFTRYGYESIVADTRAGDATSTWTELGIALAAIRFPAGTRYEDGGQDETDARSTITDFLGAIGAT